IVKPALIPSSPFNVPSKLMIVVTGIVMGLILGIVFAFGAELFDTSIGTIEDVEEVLGVPVLGVIPSLNEGEKRKIASDKKNMGRKYDLVAHYDPSSLIAEAFRTLRTNLQFISLDKKVKSFVVTSSFVQEGKSFNVVNLALSLAQTGNKVLLISADLRKPVLHKIFGLNREPGLTDYVLGNYQLKEIINTITDVMLGEFELEEVLKTPGLDNLHVINCGMHPPNPAEILRSERFKQLLEETYDDYDIILIDTPPVLPVVDAAETSKLTDGTLIVYMVGKIGRGVLKRAKVTLENVNANVTGIILNNIKPESGPDYFRYQTQYYYGKSSGKDKTG
ncbi:MAG: AAA family ATPase, partial [Desulfobacteraceae bacterium]|nr:AAA family ATPase [Desulfobacteraceae bacterium]